MHRVYSGEGMIKLRLSGGVDAMLIIYNSLREKMPNGPRGGCKYPISLTENSDGKTARLYVDLPPAAFGDLFAGRNVSD